MRIMRKILIFQVPPLTLGHWNYNKIDFSPFGFVSTKTTNNGRHRSGREIVWVKHERLSRYRWLSIKMAFIIDDVQESRKTCVCNHITKLWSVASTNDSKMACRPCALDPCFRGFILNQ